MMVLVLELILSQNMLLTCFDKEQVTNIIWR